MTDTMMIEDVVLDELVAEPSGYEFSMNDRCDADKGARRNDGKGVSVAEEAKYRATKDDMELFFCIHHYNQNSAALIAGGWKIEESPVVKNYGVKNYIYSEV